MIVLYAVFLIRLTIRFRDLYQKQALTTMMVSNVLLYGLADTLAQTLTSILEFQAEIDSPPLISIKYIIEKGRKKQIILDDDEDLLELGLDGNVEMSGPSSNVELKEAKKFNFRRLAWFMIWGFILSFFQSPWYAFLNSAYDEDNMFLQALKKVLTDQLCFSPISLAAFFAYTTVVIEGGDREAIGVKLRTLYLQTLAVNYLIWPAAQFINFILIPRPLQMPYSSTIGVFWNAFLSLRAAKHSR